jgi:sugar phosphate isomerase/epimerase
MLTRREFAGSAAAGAAAFALGSRAFGKMMDRPLGVQLYTVRSILQNDLPGTLAGIRKIGYQTVEAFAAEYKMSAKELRKAITDAGLTVPSAHFGYNDIDAKFDYAKELGIECMVCASIPAAIANSGDGYKRAADQYNKWGEQAKKVGLKFGFHDHDTEFKVFDGVTGFDILMEQTEPALVQWQMDCYWVAQAGYDPVAMLRKHGKRMQSLHLKDRKANAPISTDTGPGSQYFTEVGEGTLDWPTILRLADQNHIPNMYVEQDITERPPLECLQISYTNLRKFLST